MFCPLFPPHHIPKVYGCLFMYQKEEYLAIIFVVVLGISLLARCVAGKFKATVIKMSSFIWKKKKRKSDTWLYDNEAL